jgi:hypothetical protein
VDTRACADAPNVSLPDHTLSLKLLLMHVFIVTIVSVAPRHVTARFHCCRRDDVWVWRIRRGVRRVWRVWRIRVRRRRHGVAPGGVRSEERRSIATGGRRS